MKVNSEYLENIFSRKHTTEKMMDLSLFIYVFPPPLCGDDVKPFYYGKTLKT